MHTLTCPATPADNNVRRSVRFVHTHLHSEYSLVDSILRLQPMIDACVRMGMPALALTDENNLFALVKFYKACTHAGIKPLCGSDLWLASTDHPRPGRLTALCQNHSGYLNLLLLVSRAWRDGQHNSQARIHMTWLTTQATEGLLALLGRDSETAHIALNQGISAAAVKLQTMASIFPERLYLELTRFGREGEESWNTAALELARQLNLPVIASNDVRFLASDDFEAHEARVCIHQGRTLADPGRPRIYSDQQYLKSPADMEALFADVPEALENTLELAKRCNLELDLGHYHLPDFPVPEGHDLNSYIRQMADDGLKQRLTSAPPAAGHTIEDYQTLLKRELEVIVDMGFSGYFLIVADFINWAKQHHIPVGPGRGSGAGSLVAWALRITDLDPLHFNLLFERFLNPERVSMPDFDIDFCMERRDEVIDYVTHRYGRDHVSQIITYGSMTAKAVLRDTGRVLGLSYSQVDKLAKMIPRQPLDLTLSDALGRSKKAHDEPDRIIKEFCDTFAQDEEASVLVELALKLENLTRNVGRHAGGVVIAPRPLTGFVPLYCEPDGGGMVTQYDKDDVESIGLVKFDFLGLRTLTIIDWTVKAINAHRESTRRDALDMTGLALNDPATYELLRQAQTIAVFQLESAGMRRMLKEAKPDCFEDIIALVALYRPGPMDLIPSFIARKHGEEVIDYPDPRVQPILKETYGIMIYQEQVMQMAQILGGYTLGGADLLRRAMSKKKIDEMARHRTLFREGAAKNGFDAAHADAIFDLMEKFAGYGFNKSHAAAYALLSYQTAWLKVHYPAYFMAATISADMDNIDKVVILINEVRALGIELLPPDINTSTYIFVAHDRPHTTLLTGQPEKAIRYGLGAIKGVGRGVSESIVEERQRHGHYHDLTDFCHRLDSGKLNKRTLEALILSGALDTLAINRASLMKQLPDAIKAAWQYARDCQSGQNDLFADSTRHAPTQQPHMNGSSVPEWPLEKKLQGERDTLGYYFSAHPTDPWREELNQLTSCHLSKIAERYGSSLPHHARHHGHRFQRGTDIPCTIAGLVSSVRKRGNSEAFIRLEDGSGFIDVRVFGELYPKVASLLTRDAILVIEGTLRSDEFATCGFQLRARQVITFVEACHRRAKQLHIKLDTVNKQFIQQLQQILTGFRGGHTRIILDDYRNPVARADLVLGESWRVKALPNLLRAVRNLPGVRSAHLQLNKT